MLALLVAGGIVVADRLVERGDGATTFGGAASTPDGADVPGDGSGADPGGTSPAGGSGETGNGTAGHGGSDGSGSPITDGVGAAGIGTAGVRDGGASASAARVTETALFGTITLADGADAAGVNVTADPISLETPPAPAATLAADASASRPAKIWTARFGAAQPDDGLGVQRATFAVDPYVDESAEGGEWLIDAVALRRNYEVVFAKDGYTTQSFVVSPPDSGDRVELDVELVPGEGSISGRVVDESGRPLGGVVLTATDGTVTISTTSSSVASATAAVGDFSLESLSVPSVYTVVAQLDGSGTEVARVERGRDVIGHRPDDRDAQRRGLDLRARLPDGALLGGASVVATIGDDVYRTTTLTGGLAGRYYLPRVPIPATGTYTITASGPGVTPQSQARAVNADETGVDFRLTSSTGGIRGAVVSDTLGPLPGAFVTITP